MLSALKQNLAYSIRTLFKNPGFTIVGVLTLALGIGATTAIFSVVYAVFEPMPYPKPDQLVMVWTTNRGNRNPVSTVDFQAWKQRSSSFQAINAWTSGSFNVGGGERPEQVPGTWRTPGFFTMDGLPFMLGRDFTEEEGQPGRDHVVILSNRLWARSFASNRDIIGKDIRINGEPYTVVGVLPAGIHDRFNSQLWVPLSIQPDPTGQVMRAVSVMGRLKDNVTIAQAQAEMSGIEQQLLDERPKSTPIGVSVEPLHLNFLTDATRRNLWLLLGAVGFLLLIACVNVANLLLARGTVRRREMALRAALGASRGRLFSQLLTESLVLAAVGGSLGLLLATTIIDLIQAVMPPVGTMLPSEAEIRISVPVLLFTIAISTIAGLLFGSMPAWQATRLDLNEVLKLGGRTGSGGSRRNPRRLLVIAEFALALTLLAGGGLALRSFWNLTRVDLGIRTDHLLSFRLTVPEQRLKTPDQIRSYYRQMLEKIQAVPGVRNVTAMTGTPAGGTGMGTRFVIAGRPPANPAERQGASFQTVTSGYVDTLGIRMVKGRAFDEHDTETGMRVAIVNEFFVSRFLSGVDPIGQRIVMSEVRPGAPPGNPVEWQIVGVFHNVRGAGFRDASPEIDVPFWQNPLPRASVVLRTDGDPKTVINSVAGAVNSVDPDMPLAGVKTVDEIIGESLAIDRFSVVLFASFGALGLLLAAVGIYGVTAFGVAQRTHEFGVRIALGAQRSRVIRLVMKEATALATIGGAIGFVGAYFVGRAMQTSLYGVPALDARAFAAVFVLLLMSAWIACLIPAWRASRIEPLEALRHE
ncbi:MAG TPA: ABC transporter permease [Pyrinomonadaceae bacterium]|nr:ABC transporter permease [Pyrinomonadaceae bacterium]